jgi:hypothetical protein
LHADRSDAMLGTDHDRHANHHRVARQALCARAGPHGRPFGAPRRGDVDSRGRAAVEHLLPTSPRGHSGRAAARIAQRRASSPAQAARDLLGEGTLVVVALFPWTAAGGNGGEGKVAAPPAQAAPAKSSPSTELSFYEIRVVDELDNPIAGVAARLSAGAIVADRTNRRRRPRPARRRSRGFRPRPARSANNPRHPCKSSKGTKANDSVARRRGRPRPHPA